jgi:hypothetical protein
MSLPERNYARKALFFDRPNEPRVVAIPEVVGLHRYNRIAALCDLASRHGTDDRLTTWIEMRGLPSLFAV